MGGWFQENPGELWVSPGKTVELSCCVPDSSRSVNWYKEKPDGSLYWIYWSSGSSRPVGKYTGGMKAGRKAEQCFSLIISSAQREDSGVYYCSSHNFYHLFGKGTRLVVTGECPAGCLVSGDIPGEVWTTPKHPISLFRCYRAPALHPGAH